MQAIWIEGYVAADPSCLTSPSEKRRASFRVLETTTFTRADGEKAERTTGFNCICFSDAKVRNYIEPWLFKGSRVVVTGHVENNTWKDRDGAEHYDLRLIVDDIRIKNKREADAAGDTPAPGAESPGFTADVEDEIPF